VRAVLALLVSLIGSTAHAISLPPPFQPVAAPANNAVLGPIFLQALVVDPTTGANVGGLYTKTVSGTVQLFYIDSAGNVSQLTQSGGGSSVTGSGTTNFVPLWTGATSLGNSILQQSGGGLAALATLAGPVLQVQNNGAGNAIEAYVATNATGISVVYYPFGSATGSSPGTGNLGTTLLGNRGPVLALRGGSNYNGSASGFVEVGALDGGGGNNGVFRFGQDSNNWGAMMWGFLGRVDQLSSNGTWAWSNMQAASNSITLNCAVTDSGGVKIENLWTAITSGGRTSSEAMEVKGNNHQLYTLVVNDSVFGRSMRVRNDGAVLPGADNTGSLGSNDTRWATIRATVVTTGDLAFDDQTCAICGRRFETDDCVVWKIRKQKDGVSYSVPVHAQEGFRRHR
jgi:hypothetical protein